MLPSHPLQRLVNGWHHKFHKEGIHQRIGEKLIDRLNLRTLVEPQFAPAKITLKNLISWILEQMNSQSRFKDKHFATLVDTIVPCKYQFGSVIHIDSIKAREKLLLKTL